MFGIGKDTGVRDAIGVTVAIVTAVLLLGAAQLVPTPAQPVAPVEPVVAQEIRLETVTAPQVEVVDAAPAPAPLGRI